MGFYLGAMNTDTYQSPHGTLYAALDTMPAVDVDIRTDALRDVAPCTVICVCVPRAGNSS